jgi:hypothetical protein
MADGGTTQALCNRDRGYGGIFQFRGDGKVDRKLQLYALGLTKLISGPT